MPRLSAAPSEVGGPGKSGELVFTVTPVATGTQLVRRSLPCEPGLLATNRTLRVSDGRREVEAGVRVVTGHPPVAGQEPSARRALVTFVHEFRDLEPVRFVARPGAVEVSRSPKTWPVEVGLRGEEGSGEVSLVIGYREGPRLEARLLAPARGVPVGPARMELVESNAFFRWQRVHLPDANWPRIVEVREDALGGVIVVGHVQRRLDGDGRAPDLGWELALPGNGAHWIGGTGGGSRSFTNGISAALAFGGDRFRIEHPAAALKRRGGVEMAASDEPGRGEVYRYWRCRAAERVPLQSMAWEQAEFAVLPAGLASPTPTLEVPHAVEVETRLWQLLYGLEPTPAAFAEPRFAALLSFHREAIVRSMAVGDDWGNVTGFDPGRATGGAMGMNRLNHGPAIFAEAWRSGDRRLREVALLWCGNFHDRSIWWGPKQNGGTRYNNVRALGRTPPDDDAGYMWRSNESVNFCTKGYDAFFLAWEETGDPRFREALDAQIAYAREHLHTDRGECRNIGDARDFEQLYRWTGDSRYRAEALRLFRELRTKLSTGDLFDQGGKPLAEDPPFIEEDAAGLKVGYAKPYIIGYALAGLPDLALAEPAEPRLPEVVGAVADFLASSQDPLGAWRYPHPRSSRMILSQAMEHAWQLTQAGHLLGPREAHLDAIERVLRQRLHGWERTGRILSGLTGWELATGRAKTSEDIYRLYAKPADRDAARDYEEGAPDAGSSPPEGLVYFPEVLAYYLKHRPAERLLRAPAADEPLARVLGRLARTAADLPGAVDFQTHGIARGLPVMREALVGRLDFPLSWLAGSRTDFGAWRREARGKVMEALLAAPPPAEFRPVMVAEEDRGTYVARKVVLQLTGDSRVLGYLLVPKGKGPFPAVLLLHDHGARFDIGKEKVIEPFADRPERLASARQWVGQVYGGRFLGDELARRGYVCFATDALNWSDRGGAGYDGQQALSANLLHLGMSWAGLIAHEDVRAAEFLATRPEVDPGRVAAMGLSMGSFRTWQVSALSDRIAAGVAVCWMTTVKSLMTPGNNQTGGQSAYSMTHPGLMRFLDYPDVASLACPKPMLFYAGQRDGLFPVDGVQHAFARLRRVWESQGAADRLVTRIWDVPHVFDQEMQEAAFAWLDGELERAGRAGRAGGAARN